MINYISTRNPEFRISSGKAILTGQAPDGGLYIPEDLDAVKADYHTILNNDFKKAAAAVWNIFFPDYGPALIGELVDRSYSGKFSAEEVTPLVKVGDAYVLELYHGPTCAFKDVALSALPNLLTAARDMNHFTDEIMILTATSGDTGSAALCGFSDVPGTRITVFYPEGGISDAQRLQMVTAPGSNTSACGIKGNFDDAQNGVKHLFREIPQPAEGVSLSSANSINIGRLVPQIVYYFSAYSQLLASGEIADGDKVDFVVPTGNFGDIMAGFFALRMGLPVGRLVCASNRNNVLTEFLETGHYDRRRPFHKTSSPSMDILVSSNLERLLYYICGAEHTVSYMKQLAECGEYNITPEELTKIRSVFSGACASDSEGAAAISRVFNEEGYLMDTHTAVAWACRKKYDSEEDRKAVILSTASPYKFSAAVLEALGQEQCANDEASMKKLNELTGVPVPQGLSGIFSRTVRHTDIISTDLMKSYVIEKSR